MSLEIKIMEAIKEAMKAKQKERLEALRAVKASILLAKTEVGSKELTESDELKMLQKLVKQRKDSAELYRTQNREDLAVVEEQQAETIAEFLPQQLSEDEILKEIQLIVSQTGASGPADMGKVMGMATKTLAGKAEGKAIARLVKETLSSL